MSRAFHEAERATADARRGKRAEILGRAADDLQRRRDAYEERMAALPHITDKAAQRAEAFALAVEDRTIKEQAEALGAAQAARAPEGAAIERR
jgi:hypothetical protein